MAKQTLFYQMGRSGMRLYTRLLLNSDVQFKAPLPTGAKLIAPNHPTTLDPFLIPAFYDEQVHILVTESAFKVPLFGKYLQAAGHIPVIATQGRAAFEAAHQLLSEGKTVAIFPEGDLSPLDSLPTTARTGAVRLSLMTGAPIVPVGIAIRAESVKYLHTGIMTDAGEEEIARAYMFAPYGVTSGVPMSFDGDVNDHQHVRQLSQMLMKQIMRLSLQSSYRISASNRALNSRDTVEFPAITG